MGWIRDYPPAETKGKKLLGAAVAGGIVPPDMADLSHKASFFVVELKGESAALITPDDFVPKIW